MASGSGSKSTRRRPRRIASAERSTRSQRLAGGGRVAFVEHQVDHAERAREPLGQFVRRRHLVGDAGIADFCLRAHDALRQRGSRAQECLRDGFRREAADLAQGERHLRIRRQCRMATRENEAQPVVLDAFGVPWRRRLVGDAFDLFGDIVERVELRAPADAVDGLEPAGRHEPCARIRRHAIARPLLERRTERVGQRLFGEIEVAEQANQRGEDAPRFGAVHRLDCVRHALGGGRHLGGRHSRASRRASASWSGVIIRGELVAVLDHEAAAFRLRSQEERRGQNEPHLRLHEILPDAVPALVHDAQIGLRHRVLLVGGLPVPFDGLRVVLRNALSALESIGEVVLGVGVALLGGSEIPFRGFDGVARHAMAVFVHHAQVVLRVGDIPGRRPGDTISPPRRSSS